jgi:hypothetical protein
MSWNAGILLNFTSSNSTWYSWLLTSNSYPTSWKAPQMFASIIIGLNVR